MRYKNRDLAIRMKELGVASSVEKCQAILTQTTQAMLDLLDELETQDSLTLLNLGRFQLVERRRSRFADWHSRLVFYPAESVKQGLRDRIPPSPERRIKSKEVPDA